MRTVECVTESCRNFGIEITVPDDGTEVVCGGGCNQVLADADPERQPEPRPVLVQCPTCLAFTDNLPAHIAWHESRQEIP